MVGWLTAAGSGGVTVGAPQGQLARGVKVTFESVSDSKLRHSNRARLLSLAVERGETLQRRCDSVENANAAALDWAAPERLLVPMRSMRNDIWAAPCGDAGADTTVEAASKLKCTVSNYSDNR